MIEGLGTLVGCRIRLWWFDRGRLGSVAGGDGVAPPPVDVTSAGDVTLPDASRLLLPVTGLDGYWYEIAEAQKDPETVKAQLGPILANLLQHESDTLRIAKALAARLEEIDLIYSITETLGRTVQLHEAAQKIVEAVSQGVGARRASILAYDHRSGDLRAVACVGKDVKQYEPVPVDDPSSIAARVFRTRRPISYDPRVADEENPACATGRDYRGSAFLSVPIFYTMPDGEQRTVGVINLTDRVGADAFSTQEQRLVGAIASQIGVAIENARLVARDLERQRLRQELQLAHDLQLKLLPSPAVLGGHVDAAALCRPAESVGGDFYSFLPLPHGRVGVMLGDVSSHGFSSALIMALVLSAAGIRAMEAATPADALRALLDSVKTELAETEMHLALFYGVADGAAAVLRYANAGHPHAFRVAGGGGRERLRAASPPLGLAEAQAISGQEAVWRPGDDLLVLFSDGIADAANEAGEKFGEDKVLDIVAAHHDEPAAAIVHAVFDAVEGFTRTASDDRTVLVLRA